MYINSINTIQRVLREFENELMGYSVEKKCTDDGLINVYILNDSLVLLAEFVGRKVDCVEAGKCKKQLNSSCSYLDDFTEEDVYYFLRVEELTPNVINYKFDRVGFAKKMSHDFGISDFWEGLVSYARYEYDRNSFWYYTVPGEEPDANIKISRIFPELNLKERCDAWPGKLYHFIVLEFEDVFGYVHRACTYTTGKPHSCVLNICKSWIKTGRLKGSATYIGSIERDMEAAFNSWRGVRRQKRLEEHLKYFSVEVFVKKHEDIFENLQYVLENANVGKYNNIARSTYSRPVNKWISEELVYKIAKKYYKQYQVIYQHRPFFLRSPKDGQMSYDIFISGMNVAIEYQGKQHFEPIEYFGGKESFDALQERDKLKQELSLKNGIKLVYINYWEEITPDLIIERVGVDPRH